MYRRQSMERNTRDVEACEGDAGHDIGTRETRGTANYKDKGWSECREGKGKYALVLNL